MDIKHYKYFESLVRNKNFTKAAKELHISQPTLSNLIKLLEENLGTRLIERNTRVIVPTEAGKILYKRANKILEMHRCIMEEISDASLVGGKKLIIGMVETSKYWITEILPEFQSLYPNVKIILKEMGSYQIEEALHSYDIHLGILSSKSKASNIVYHPIYSEDLFLIVSDYHPFSKKNSIDYEELQNEPIIDYSSSLNLKTKLLKIYHDYGLLNNITFEVDRLETVHVLVKNNLGLAIVPANYLKYASMEGISKVKIENRLLNRMVYISYNKDRYILPSAKTFLQLTRNYFKTKDLLLSHQAN